MDLRRPYLMLMDRAGPQRRHDPPEVFNALRWIVRTGAVALLPTNFPPWAAVYQQTQRWLARDYECLPETVAARISSPSPA